MRICFLYVSRSYHREQQVAVFSASSYMTDGEKNCGLSSFLPMSCRGRAEAFARRLHSRLRTLGTQDGDDGYSASESSWLASNSGSPSVTSLQPRHSTDNDLFMDFGIFDTPGSPEEEITESELSRFITNPKDNLHMPRVQPDCQCKENHLPNKRNQAYDTLTSPQEEVSESELAKFITNPKDALHANHLPKRNQIYETLASPEEEISESEYAKFITNPKDNLDVPCKDNFHENDRSNSLDSDSSDGPYYDPLDADHLLHNHINGISSVESDRCSEDSNNHESLPCALSADSCLPSSSCTSTLSLESRNPSFSAEDSTVSLSKQESLTETVSEDQVDATMTSGWQVTYEPQKCNRNNNVYSAIDFETLKSKIESNYQDVEDSEDSYSSRLEVEHNLTVECPDVSETSLEIQDTDEISEQVLDDESIETQETEITEIETKVEPEVDLAETFENICIRAPSEEREEQTDKTNTHERHHEDEHLLRARSAQDFIDDDDEEKEERTPRVRRCSSLKTGKTPPGTPGRKKIVRFADVLGLDLADVRTFMDEIPKIPTSAYDDLNDVDISLSLSDTSLCSNSSPMELNHPKPAKMLMPLFQQPGGEPNFLDRVRENQVCLENAVVSDPQDLSVNGTVRVRNLDFNKSVHIRYTTDHWKTFADLQATYVNNSCDGFSDKFTFTLYVHTLAIGQKLEFAVRYHCKGCQYWDNNSGINYCFECLPTCVNSPYVPITRDALTHHDDHWIGAAFY